MGLAARTISGYRQHVVGAYIMQGADREKTSIVVRRSLDDSALCDCVGAGDAISHHAHPNGKGPLHVPGRLPDTLGQDRDYGDGEVLVKSLRSPRFARP